MPKSALLWQEAKALVCIGQAFVSRVLGGKVPDVFFCGGHLHKEIEKVDYRGRNKVEINIAIKDVKKMKIGTRVLVSLLLLFCSFTSVIGQNNLIDLRLPLYLRVVFGGHMEAVKRINISYQDSIKQKIETVFKVKNKNKGWYIWENSGAERSFIPHDMKVNQFWACYYGPKLALQDSIEMSDSQITHYFSPPYSYELEYDNEMLRCEHYFDHQDSVRVFFEYQDEHLISYESHYWGIKRSIENSRAFETPYDFNVTSTIEYQRGLPHLVIQQKKGKEKIITETNIRYKYFPGGLTILWLDHNGLQETLIVKVDFKKGEKLW